MFKRGVGSKASSTPINRMLNDDFSKNTINKWHLNYFKNKTKTFVIKNFLKCKVPIFDGLFDKSINAMIISESSLDRLSIIYLKPTLLYCQKLSNFSILLQISNLDSVKSNLKRKSSDNQEVGNSKKVRTE